MGYKVLIVDDSSVMRKIIMRNLRQAGIPLEATYEAGDGYEALKVLQEKEVDVIFSDINMPNMDGLNFVRELRKHPVYRKVKVIMITTEAGSDMVHEALNAGADGYLVKPFTPEKLAERLEDVYHA
jgi:two-component system chemotaxis response regulator CheY